jgi:serine/threonine-protein kinase
MPTSPAADRNLLFGVLALQMDFVGRNALLRAMHAWVLEKSRPLGDLLREQGALSAEHHALVEALVQAHLKAHGDDPQRSLAAVSSVSSVRRDLEQLGDADLHASLAHVAARPADDPQATRPEGVGAPTAAGQRFRILRPHAKGGLGEVFVARDEELHREVALKEIQQRRANDQASRARFLLEAEVTGGLEHPGIVPVYGLGQYGDGRPFYAMRFIKGDSLQEAVASFHEADRPGRDPGERTLALRGLLGRFVDVCNAVYYAHGRGVLHRDLKPGNVMLGKYGETLVVDWGLAKVVGHPDGATAATEGTLRPEAGSGATPTETGQALGTPAYMSPEQAAGRLEELGPASDVYSLGATLYCLLTGRPPFQGRDHGALLQQVQKGAFPPPRQVKPGVPAALEAVCLRALALRPESRYATPRDLADEVERWLADEPVRAYREPVVQRLGRWGRRHRTAAASAAVLLVTAVLGLAVGLVAVNAERQRTEAARAAEAQRRQQARAALDALSSEVIDDWLARQPQLTDQQRKFLERALTSYEEFARDTGQDEQSRAGVADAYLRVGNILHRLGKFQEAEAAYRACQERFAQLAADYPAVPQYRRGLFTAHSSQANILSDTGRAEEAERGYRTALELLERLADDYPGEVRDQDLRARSHNNLGILLRHKGRLREAEEEVRAALALEQRLADEHPAVPQYRRELARIHNVLGTLLENKGRSKEAEDEYRAGLALAQRLVADDPAAADNRLPLAELHGMLGLLLTKAGRPNEVEKEYSDALSIQQRLADDYPAVPRYREKLGSFHMNLGVLYGQYKRPKEKEEEQFRAALAEFQRLAHDHPDVPRYQQALARSHLNLGILLQVIGRVTEAEEMYRKAQRILQKLADKYHDVPDYRSVLALSHNNLGILLQHADRPEEAAQEFRRTSALCRELVQEFPDNADYHNALANALEALAELAQARKDFAEARRLLEEALPHNRAALQANPRHPNYRENLRETLQTLAEVLLAQGEHAEAVAAADQLAQKPFESAKDRYRAACVLAGCVPLAAKDGKLPGARRQELAREYADRAMTVLRQAVTDGYKDAAQLRKEPALDQLRDRDDFKKLLADLDKAPAPPKPAPQQRP